MTEYKYERGQVVTINLGHGKTTVAKLMSRDYCPDNPPTWFVRMPGEMVIHEDDMTPDIPREFWGLY